MRRGVEARAGRARTAALAAIPVGLVLVLAAPAGAAAATRFVDRDTGLDAGTCSTAATACASVGHAVGVAGAGDTIQVDDSPGSYPETLSLGSGRSVIGVDFTDGDEGATVIDGGGSTPIVVVGGESANTISGLTLRSSGPIVLNALGAVASVTDNRFEASSSGTGIDINTGTATISDNVFVNAITTGVTDTGIRVDGATATIADNDFNGIGIAIQLGADSAAPNTQVTGNEITGVHLGTITGFGILAQRSTGVVVTDNEISAPASLAGTNGIQVSGSGSPASAQLRRNQVYDHGRGVFLSDLASATMDDDLLAGNATGLTAFDDTGVGSGDVAVKNLTVTDAAPGATEDVFVFGTDADLSLDSSIVGDLGIAASAGGSCAITRSRGPSTTPGGDGCADFQTTATPDFVNPGTNDYHLTAANPALIDQGDPATPVAPDQFDFEGQKRAADGDGDCSEVRDLGADELLPAPPTATITAGPGQGSTIATRNTSFSFVNSSPCAGASFECRLDGGSFAPCVSGSALGPLNEGSHTFRVRALDLVPQAGATVTRSFTVDLPSPPPPPPPSPPPTTTPTPPVTLTPPVNPTAPASPAASAKKKCKKAKKKKSQKKKRKCGKKKGKKKRGGK